MKKISIASLMIFSMITACGPSADELAAREKVKMDSVAKVTAEAIAAKAKEDSINEVKRMEADAKRIADSLATAIDAEIANENCKELRAHLATAEVQLEDLKGFKIGRTATEKQEQLTRQYKLIEDLKDALRNCPQ